MAATNEATATPQRYRVVHPHPNAMPMLGGQKWTHGVLFTDDATLASSLTEYGCQVFDGDSQRHSLGTHTPAEQKRIEAARKWAFGGHVSAE